jgi:topoisomerase-4 subunit A
LKAGKAFMTLDEGDEPVAPRIVGDDDSAIACLSEKGRLLVFGMDEMKTLSGGGRGVILMELDKNEKLLAAQPISKKGVIVSGTGRAGKAQELPLSASVLAPHIGKRARKGKALEGTKLKPNALAAVK